MMSLRRPWTLIIVVMCLAFPACDGEPSGKADTTGDTPSEDTVEGDIVDGRTGDDTSPPADTVASSDIRDSRTADSRDTEPTTDSDSRPTDDASDATDAMDADDGGESDPGPEPLFADDFESGDNSHAENGVQWHGLGSDVDVSTERAHSGSHALAFHYPSVPGGEDSSAELRFDLPDLEEMWMEYYVWVPSNFYHRDKEGPENNKFLRIWGGDYGNSDPKFGASYRPMSGGDEAYGYVQWGDHDTTILGAQDPDSHWDLFTAATKGSWIRVRWHAKLATSEQAEDGEIQLWQDGELEVDFQNLDFYGDQTEFFDQGYLFGWSNSGFDEETTFYVDDFTIYDSDPGW